MNYFVKTFKIEDSKVFSFSKDDLRPYLPDGWDIKGSAEPVISFHPGAVTVAIEIFERKRR